MSNAEPPALTSVEPASDVVPRWKTLAVAAASEALPRPVVIDSGETKLLLVLLCFLANSEVPLDLLYRGATCRKRWDIHGEIEEADALQVGICPELVDLISNIAKMDHAFDELESLSAISRNNDKVYRSYTLDIAVRIRVANGLPLEYHSFWRLQALVVTYRSIPWKYLEHGPFDMRTLVIPHLRHALQEVQNHDEMQKISANTRTDLILTLVEASRFPDTQWKLFAISQAKEAIKGLNDIYLQSCIAQRECLLHRTTGDMDQAASALANASSGHLLVESDKRMHAGFGYMAIQRAWNHTQLEELDLATKVLDAWQPVDGTPSTSEEIVLFRKYLLLGKISRFQGKFGESLVHLQRSKDMASHSKDLFFDEDRCDLVCSLANTFEELDDPFSAENHLRTEIALQGQDRTSSWRFLRLALAESLFAQGQYGQVLAYCSEVQSCPRLSKMENLCLSIVQAKLSHVNAEWAGAARHWTDALGAVDRFTMTSGQTTRIILLSICETQRHQGQHELELKFRDKIAVMERLATSAEPIYWIAGLRHWIKYLDTTGSLDRITSNPPSNVVIQEEHELC